MPQPLSNQTVVITGASSGIGRATAVELGRHGARMVLAARNSEALHDAAREADAAGGTSHVIVADVAHWDQVERLAQEAVDRFGAVDTWINNAAVTQYALLEDTTPEEAEQILRVNLLGQIHGCKAALAIMKEQGSGHIINVGSIESWFGVPYSSVYAASKHGVKGLTESLRRELALEGVPVDVSLISPSGVNTPLFDHARSKIGGKPMPLPPAYPPETVAEAIAHVCEYPQREVVVGGAGKLFTVLERIHPALLDFTLQMRSVGKEGQRSEQTKHPEDNLFGPASGPYQVHGTFENITRSTSLYTRFVELHPLVKGLLVGAGVVGAASLLGRLMAPSPNGAHQESLTATTGG